MMQSRWLIFSSLLMLLPSAGCERKAPDLKPPEGEAPPALPAALPQAGAPPVSAPRAAPTPPSQGALPPPEGIVAAVPGVPAPPIALLPSTGMAPPSGVKSPAFLDATVALGIRHRHRKGEFDPKLANIMPWIASIGAAVAAADVDDDGDIDFYASSSRQGAPNALYLNQRFSPGARPSASQALPDRPKPLFFVEAAAAAGVASVNDKDGVTMDVAFGDLDNDGDQDLYIVQWGKNRLFENDGAGRFKEVTDAAGVGDRGNGNCALFFDHDNDGDLDILVCNYFRNLDLNRIDSTLVMHDSFERARNGGANILYRNDGKLHFTEVAHILQLDDTGWSLDAGITDLDNDGDMDVYIANDFGPDRLFLSNGDGTFANITQQSIGPDTRKGMNVDCGDLNGDGFTDIYVSNITTAEYLKEGNMLWLNNGDRTFTDVAFTTGTADGGWGWGARLFDYDDDGDLDILTLNGFVSNGPETYWNALANIAVMPSFNPEDAAQWPAMGNQSLSGYEPSRLFRSNGDGSFAEVARVEGLTDKYDGRGLALADFDGDGDLDAVVANQDQPVLFYLNQTNPLKTGRHWASFRLRGTRSNRDAIGARVELAAGPLKLVREVNGVNGFSSESDLALHFGLGAQERIDRATVFWPSGVVNVFQDMLAGRHYVLEERGEPLPPENRLPRYFARLKEAGPKAAKGREEGSLADSPRGAELLALEQDLRRRPRNAALGNAYRTLAKKLGTHDRCIEFFRGLIAGWSSGPVPAALHFQLSLALIDKIPAMQNDVLAQGSLAKESLAEVAYVLEERRDSYVGNFIAGMNHLYWPENLKHAPDAIRHLEFCRQVIEKSGRGEAVGPIKPFLDQAHWLELHLAHGDACVKDKNFPKAREIWKDALAAAPEHDGLKKRLALADEPLAEFIRDLRGLSRPIDTGLKVFEAENDLAAREAEILRSPENRQALNAWRAEVAELGAFEPAESFLQQMGDESGKAAEPLLHQGLLIFDRAFEGSANGQAVDLEKEAARAMKAIGEHRKRQPADWVAPYLKAQVLLWLACKQPGDAAAPGKSGKTSQVDFEGLLAELGEAERLSRRLDGSPRLEYPGLAKGDALALSGRVREAREAWSSVAQSFPKSQAAQLRLQSQESSLKTLIAAEWIQRPKVFTDLEPLVDLESELEALEQSLSNNFNRAVSDRYRRMVKRGGDPDRAIRFLGDLVKKSPSSSDARVQLALALLDRIPDRELGSVRKGLLSNDALSALGPVARAFPRSWGMQVLLGTFHLNWFTKLGHVPEAIACFERAIAIFESSLEEGKKPEAAGAAGGEARKPRYADAYQALGDALVKDHKFAEARNQWKRGLKRFPESRGLEERMGLTSLMVNGFVDRRRSWDAVEDTSALSEAIGDLPPLPPGTIIQAKSP